MTTFEDLRHIGCHVRLHTIHVIRMRAFKGGDLIMYCGTRVPAACLDDDLFVDFKIVNRDQWPDEPACKTCKKLSKGRTYVVLDDGTTKREAFV